MHRAFQIFVNHHAKASRGRATDMSRVHPFFSSTVIAAILACGACGCAFGDRHVAPTYQPVMSIKAGAPQAVNVPPFASKRGLKNEAQIGRVRNTYGMATAKVFTKSGDA